ncbi:unnamed protein product, partial [Tenebrio molitor]
MLVTESLIKDLIGVFVTLVVVLIGYYKWSFTYWKRKNLPYVEPSIPFGNLVNPLSKKEAIGMTLFRLYNQMKHNKWKHGGIYCLARPTYYLIDPDYIKNVMATDFHHFVDRGLYYNEKADPLSAHLLSIGGAKWRNLRMKLSPAFTSSKMKMMFPTLMDCEAGLQTRIEQECQHKQPIDIKEVFACFANDVIGSCAFGLDCHTFKEENSPFRIYSKKCVEDSAIEMLKRIFACGFPNIATAQSVTLTPKDVESFFMKVVKDTVKYREEKDVQRKDFMQLLIDMKNNELAEDGRTLTIEEIAAQSVIFFIAGFETSSTTMSFALYELSKNQDIQQKVREEVKSVLAKYGGMTFGLIQSKVGLASGSLCGNLVAISVAILTIVVAYYKWTYQYWRRRNFPYLEPRIPFGNTHNLFRRKENPGTRVKRHYDIMRAKGWKHGGLYSLLKPSYLVLDLDYIKNIMTKDFQYFTDRGFYYNEKDDPLSAHLFAIGGQKWRNLRTKVAKVPTDIKEALGCFTTDIIGSCAFGLDCNTFAEENSPFREYGRKVFNFNGLRLFKLTFSASFPKTAKILGVTQTPEDVSNFFIKVVKDTVSYREKNNYTRKDFLQLLIDLKNNKLAEDEGYKHDGDTLSIEEIAAQSFVFFIAGFETSSTTMTFALYELSKHQELQDKVRDEVDTVLAIYGGKITYEAIQEMKYMDQVINETLRKYPPLPLLTRKCVRDYKIPGTDLIIEKGTGILIPVLGIHYDKEYYPDPEKFDPERFTEENKKSRHHYA